MPSQTLILVPGLACDAEVWAAQAAALADAAAVEIADHRALDSLGAMAEAIIAAAPARFAIAGHSMGGRVALEVVRRAAPRIDGLALLDTGARALPAGEAGQRERAEREALVALARREGMGAVARRWLQIPMVYPERLTDRALIERIVAMFERKSVQVFAAQVRALIDRPDAMPLLSAIACPTLVLCGADDAWSKVGAHQEMAALIRGSTLVTVALCGHMATMERPVEVNGALRVWLESLRTRRA
jgi:pimeloyl-ACP methyl ester carboxylesterase